MCLPPFLMPGPLPEFLESALTLHPPPPRLTPPSFFLVPVASQLLSMLPLRLPFLPGSSPPGWQAHWHVGLRPCAAAGPVLEGRSADARSLVRARSVH